MTKSPVALAPLEDLVSLLIDHRGRTPKKLGGDFVSSGVPVISARNIKGGRIARDSVRFITPDMHERWMPQRLRPGDVLLTSEAPLGEAAYLKEADYCLGQRLFALRANPKRLNPRFLYYVLLSPQVQHSLTARATGTTVAGIKQSELRKVMLPTPPLAVQTKIVSVLAAHDDLIDNNLRRIEILEEMAHGIYQEWFVNFCFPCHEDVRLQNSAIGEIPEGWQVTPLSAVSEARRGLSWNRDQETTGTAGIGVLTIPNVQDRLDPTPRFRLSQVSTEDAARFSLRRGDTLMIGSNGNPERVGQTVWVSSDVDGLFASFLMRIRPAPQRISPYLLFHELRDPRITQPLQAGAIGATGLRNIRISALRGLPILLPSPDVQSQFDSQVKLMFDLMGNLDAQTRILRSARDSLLPNLISGHIDVSDLDIDTAWLAE